MIALFLSLIFLLQCSSAQTTAPQAPFPSIPFSDFVQTFDALSDLGWKLFKIQFPLTFNNFGARYYPDGSSLLLNANGDPQVDFRVFTDILPNKTQRMADFNVMNLRGVYLLRIAVYSMGHDLKPYDADQIRKGIFPYLPSEGDTFHRVKMWINDNYLLKIDTTIDVRDGMRNKVVRMQAADDSRFITYTETETPVSHVIRYDLEPSPTYNWVITTSRTIVPLATPSNTNLVANEVPGNQLVSAFIGNNKNVSAKTILDPQVNNTTQLIQSLQVVKDKKEGLLWGNETYFVNENQVDVKTYRYDFDNSVLTFILTRWQAGLGSVPNILYLQ